MKGTLGFPEVNSTMTYKGYTLGVRYSDEDGLLVGRVVGLRYAIIDCMGESVAALKTDFYNAVDQYLEMCEEDGVSPEKPRARKRREKVEA